MSFVNYSKSEDMQDNTYSIVAIRLDATLTALENKDVEAAHALIRGLYTIIHHRIKDESIKERLNQLKKTLYGKDIKRTPEQFSQCLDEAEEILMIITAALDESGILFRIRTNIDELVTKGGMT